jgi:hypothetical protein
MHRATALALIMLAASAGLADPPDGHAIAEKSVNEFVNQKSGEIRDKLQNEFLIVDRQRLLQMKENVDTFLSTFLLIEDAATRPAWNWWALPAEEYREGDFSPWQVTGPPQSPHDLLADPSISQRFSARLSWLAPSGEDYPVMMWTDGTIAPGTGEVHVRYYEPYLANRSLAFTLHPERLIIRWSPRQLQILDHGGSRLLAQENAGQRDHIFNNPEYTYALFDTLRLKLGGPEGEWKASGHTNAPTAAAWTAGFENGRPIRSVERTAGEDFIRVGIHQQPVMLHHQSPITFEVRRDYVDGSTVAEPYVPTTQVEYLAGGRDIDIDLNRHGSNWFPGQVRIAAEGALLYEAELEPEIASSADSELELRAVLDRLDGLYLAIDKQKAGARIQAYPIDAIHRAGPHMRRAMLKYNAFASLYGRNVEALSAWLDEYRAMLESEGVPLRFHIYNIEAMAQVASDAIDPSLAARIVTGPLEREYARTDPEELAEHALRLISQFRVGPAVVALDVLARSTNSPRSQWAIELAGKLRTAWHAGEIEPGTQYPYADQSAKLTIAILSRIDASPKDARIAQEAAR